MVMKLNVLEREVVIVHNADEDQYKNFFGDVVSAAFKACKKGEKVVLVADFTYAPNIPMHILNFSTCIDDDEAMKKIREELYLPDTVFSHAEYFKRITGKHPRDILASRLDEELNKTE